jgi:hypothetical protein
LLTDQDEKSIFIENLPEAALPNEPKLVRMHLWKVLYNDCSFISDPFTNMVATDNSCFLLINFFKIFSSETALPNEPKLSETRISCGGHVC